MRIQWLIIALLAGFLLSVECFAQEMYPPKTDDERAQDNRKLEQGRRPDDKSAVTQNPKMKKNRRPQNNKDWNRTQKPNDKQNRQVQGRKGKVMPNDRKGDCRSYTKKDKFGNLIHYDCKGRVISKDKRPR